MAVTEEEARAKLSLDTSDLETGGRRITRFSEDAHRSFLHAGTPARGFHKLLESISGQSEIAGRTLQIAISPVAGVFAAAAAGIAFANEKLKEFNRHLDEIRADTIKPLINVAGREESIASRVASTRESSAAFARDQRDKVPVLQGLDETEKWILGNTPAGPARDEMQRAFIEAAHKRLIQKALELDKGKTEAEGKVGAKDLQKYISDVKDKLKDTTSKFEELNKQKAKLQESEATEPALKGGTWGDILTGDEPKEMANDKKLNDLKKYADEITKYSKLLKTLTDIDKANNEGLREKEKELAKVLDAIRELEKEQSKIPLPQMAPGIARPGVGPIQTDPATGGIPYRPLIDKNGIPYRPLRGAPGYEPIVPPAPPTLFKPDDTIAALNFKMQLLVDAAIRYGILLKLPE